MISRALYRMKQKMAYHSTQDFKDRFKDFRQNLPLVELGSEHLANAVLLANRQELLRHVPKRARIVEAGVAAGDFSQDILDIAQPEELQLIDAWHSDRYNNEMMKKVTARFEPEITAGQVVLNRGLSTDVVHILPDRYFDVIYIDTDHTYDTTLEELRLFSRKLKPGGMLAGHDYVIGSFPSIMMYGVIAAVHKFCVEDGWKVKFLTVEQGTFPSFAIEKMAG